jgi:uncharacterized protein
MRSKKTSESTRVATFLLDGMLGSLTRKLRILGFDTLYDPKSDDAHLLRLAIDMKRCLVTSDIALYVIARRAKVDSILITSRTEKGRLFEIFSKIGVSKIDNSKPPRCSVCNGKLEVSGNDEQGRLIFKCSDCGKEYWKGSHWKKLSSLFHEVDLMLRDGGMATKVEHKN